MSNADARNLKVAIVVTIIILLVLISMPAPAFSQGNTPPTIQNLVVNGGFEGGFQQDFGIGYGWGGFSNGNAVVGWNFDSWKPVVAAGEYSQSIELKDALSQDRYAGIYQTISVVPGEQYKLTIKGLIRSEEGDIKLSDYGYRAQYAIDYNGDTAWELLPASAWQELPWDEQPAANPESQNYQYKTFETTITAQGDQLTLFIRGWKKWLNKGSGIFNFDEISIVGPGPEGFQAPEAQAAQTASVGSGEQQPAGAMETAAETSTQTTEAANDTDQAENVEAEVDSEAAAPQMESSTETETTTPETMAPAEAPAQTDKVVQAEETTTQAVPSNETGQIAQAEAAQLPVSGLGSDDSLPYVLTISIILLLILFVGAITASLRQRNLAE